MSKLKNLVANTPIIIGGLLTTLSEKLVFFGAYLHKRFNTETGKLIAQFEDAVMEAAKAQASPKLNLPTQQTGESNAYPKPFYIKTPGNS
jgi:hypothetical protein